MNYELGFFFFFFIRVCVFVACQINFVRKPLAEKGGAFIFLIFKCHILTQFIQVTFLGEIQDKKVPHIREITLINQSHLIYMN